MQKGLWRGTEVAVKTMILPANMTGQQKREKMAVMEAAISSSLVHPNIGEGVYYQGLCISVGHGRGASQHRWGGLAGRKGFGERGGHGLPVEALPPAMTKRAGQAAVMPTSACLRV